MDNKALTFIIFLILTLAVSGCVSSSEHERVLAESAETAEALKQCRANLKGESERIRMLTEANTSISKQVEESRKRRESLGELVAECEFAVRERDDEFRDQAETLMELRGELEARQKALDAFSVQQNQSRELAGAVNTLVEDLNVIFADLIEDGLVSVNSERGSARLTINNSLLYKGHGIKLTDSGGELLSRAADSFRRVGISSLVLEGYTDSTPPGGELGRIYPSNWGLSAARAASAAEYLDGMEGIVPGMIAAAGRSDNSPLADNSTKEGRVRNRRLVIIITPAVGEARSEQAPGD